MKGEIVVVRGCLVTVLLCLSCLEAMVVPGNHNVVTRKDSVSSAKLCLGTWVMFFSWEPICKKASLNTWVTFRGFRSLTLCDTRYSFFSGAEQSRGRPHGRVT